MPPTAAQAAGRAPTVEIGAADALRCGRPAAHAADGALPAAPRLRQTAFSGQTKLKLDSASTVGENGTVGARVSEPVCLPLRL